MDGTNYLGTKTKRPVLVVEDNDLVKETIHDLLGDLGYAPKSFSNGPEALQHLTEQRYQVALIDLMMYPMNGNELAQRAVELQPDLSIIIMTGHGHDVVDEYRFPKNFSLLHKPFDVCTLQSAIQTAINGYD